MLVIRKITQEDQISIQQLCKIIDKTEFLEGSKVYWGIFNNEELLGYTKIDFHTLSLPLIDDLQINDSLESSIVEGLLRGTFHYCNSNNHEIIAIREIHWLQSYLKEALDATEEKNYDNNYLYEVNLAKFFNKPCKGRSMCH